MPTQIQIHSETGDRPCNSKHTGFAMLFPHCH